jgi:peptidoglycan/LPS O-acetylase OafA/YrhL
MSRALIWTPTVMSAGFGLIILGIANFTKVPRIVVALARISYAIYLLHMVIIEILVYCLHQPVQGGANLIVPLLLLIAGSYLLSLLVEYPFIRMYKKPQDPLPIPVAEAERVLVSNQSSR